MSDDDVGAAAPGKEEFGFSKSGPLGRVFFDGVVRREHRRGHISDAQLADYQQVMANPESRTEFFQQLHDFRQGQLDAGAKAFPDGILKLAQWVIDNWDEIAKMIAFIISLFATSERPAT